MQSDTVRPTEVAWILSLKAHPETPDTDCPPAAGDDRARPRVGDGVLGRKSVRRRAARPDGTRRAARRWRELRRLRRRSAAPSGAAGSGGAGDAGTGDAASPAASAAASAAPPAAASAAHRRQRRRRGRDAAGTGGRRHGAALAQQQRRRRRRQHEPVLEQPLRSPSMSRRPAAPSDVLWGVQNDPSDAVLPAVERERRGSAMTDDGWTNGKALHYPDGTGSPDAEGLTPRGMVVDRDLRRRSEREQQRRHASAA